MIQKETLMEVVRLVCAVGVTVIATAVMLYLSMATPIGPWIEVSVALVAALVCYGAWWVRANSGHAEGAAAVVAAAGMGGITATVGGFILPTLYFLDSSAFATWMSQPLWWCIHVGVMVAIAGSIAYLVVSFLPDFVDGESALAFPIGKVTAGILQARDSVASSLRLVAGSLVSMIFHGLDWLGGVMPRTVTLLPSVRFGLFVVPRLTCSVQTLPLFVAIGAVASHVICVPLSVGVVTQVLVLRPVHAMWFSGLSYSQYVFAFGSGMIVYGALRGMMKVPVVFGHAWSRLATWFGYHNYRTLFAVVGGGCLAFVCGAVGLGVYAPALASYVFSFGYLVVCSCLFAYQLALIGGKTGMAPFGRFATLGLLPAMVMFGYGAYGITFASCFIALVGALTVELFFGQTMARQLNISRRYIAWYQLVGLCVAAGVLGVLFVVVVSRFGLGSAELLAQRAQARAALVRAPTFDGVVLCAGALFGYLCTRFRVNPTLVFTGVMFPPGFSVLLLIGAVAKWWVYPDDETDAFWSGIFATSSLAMVACALW